jgi:hypothetical protein
MFIIGSTLPLGIKTGQAVKLYLGHAIYLIGGIGEAAKERRRNKALTTSQFLVTYTIAQTIADRIERRIRTSDNCHLFLCLKSVQ